MYKKVLCATFVCFLLGAMFIDQANASKKKLKKLAALGILAKALSPKIIPIPLAFNKPHHDPWAHGGGHGGGHGFGISLGHGGGHGGGHGLGISLGGLHGGGGGHGGGHGIGFYHGHGQLINLGALPGIHLGTLPTQIVDLLGQLPGLRIGLGGHGHGGWHGGW